MMEMYQENWKRNLEDFINEVSSPSYHIESGGFRKNLLSFGIYGRHRRRVKDKVGKMVIYADTSESAFKFCSTMIPEVSEMAINCEITECDINLFADHVYDEHQDLDINDVSSVVSVNESVPSTKKVSLNNVYNHILDNYMDDYELDDDVSAIIILTDVDRFDNSEKIDKLESFDCCCDKMLFLVNNQMGKNMQEIENLLPKNGRLIAIAQDEI